MALDRYHLTGEGVYCRGVPFGTVPRITAYPVPNIVNALFFLVTLVSSLLALLLFNDAHLWS